MTKHIHDEYKEGALFLPTTNFMCTKRYRHEELSGEMGKTMRALRKARRRMDYEVMWERQGVLEGCRYWGGLDEY